MRKRFSVGFLMTLVGAGLFSALVAGYLIGIRQVNAPGRAEKTYQINLGSLHLRLTAGMMGLVIIFILALLMLVAGLFAFIAYRRHRRVELVEKEKEEARRQADQELQAGEERYRTLFETMDEGFCVVEMAFDESMKAVDYRFIEVNPAFAKQTGLEDAVGKNVRDLISNLEEFWFEAFGDVVLTGQPIRFERSAIAMGRWFEVYATRMGGFESRKVAITFNNITARKEAEKKLRNQLVRLDLLQQITRAMGERLDLPSIFNVVIRRLENELPVDFCCLGIYDAAAGTITITGVGVKSEALAKEMSELSPIDINRNGLLRCINGQLVYEPEISNLSFPLTERLVLEGMHSLVMAPLLLESKVFGLLLVARHEANSFSSEDCEFLRQLSEHVALAAHQAQLYEALEQAYNDLRETQEAVMQQERLRAVGQMASGIAHDINNALAPMSLYVETILESEANLSERSRESLEIVERAIDDVAATVARLREFYRQREPEMTLTQIDLNTLSRQAIELTRARWRDIAQQQGTGIEVATNFAPDLPLIMGAESEIREALINLIFNAIDSMPKGGTLTIQTRATTDPLNAGAVKPHVELAVTDMGVGMDEQTRRRCLEPFFTTKGERGSGLGLAMVYGMVERHSANLEIESAVGQGTTVRLIFPVACVETPEASKESSASIAMKSQRILLVDDDPIVLKSLRQILENDGHLVHAASGGKEGIDTFRRAMTEGATFSLVVTDLGMPYVDGRQVAGTIKQLSGTTPIILLTGWGERMVAEGAVPPNVDRVLGKPPKLRELREAIGSVCGLSLE